MSTQEPDRKVHEARTRLDELRDEAQRACNDYAAHLGELISAVDAKDAASINYSFDGTFSAGERLRDIIEEDVSALLSDLAPDEKPDTAKPGPNLRAAVAMLPAKSHLGPCREQYVNKDAADILERVGTELKNVSYRIRALEAAVNEFNKGHSQDLESGIGYFCDDLRDNVEALSLLVYAVARDEKGWSIPESWS